MRTRSKENYVQWRLVNDIANLQDRLIDNINWDINILDNNFTIQHEVGY